MAFEENGITKTELERCVIEEFKESGEIKNGKFPVNLFEEFLEKDEYDAILVLLQEAADSYKAVKIHKIYRILKKGDGEIRNELNKVIEARGKKLEKIKSLIRMCEILEKEKIKEKTNPNSDRTGS